MTHLQRCINVCSCIPRKYNNLHMHLKIVLWRSDVQWHFNVCWFLSNMPNCACYKDGRKNIGTPSHTNYVKESVMIWLFIYFKKKITVTVYNAWRFSLFHLPFSDCNFSLSLCTLLNSVVTAWNQHSWFFRLCGTISLESKLLPAFIIKMQIVSL